MINKPPINELCRDEIKDFVLDLVKRELQNVPPGLRCRRRELCESILACNKETGERAKTKQDVSNIILTWSCRKDQIGKLEALGFHLTKGRTHYKLTWNGSSCMTTISATPSDFRATKKQIADITRTFF